jgi:hypothetical protein
VATTLVDWDNTGTIPQQKTSGNWTPSAFNTGRFRWTWTPTNASSNAAWRPGGLTYWGMVTTNDVNGGGIWLKWTGSQHSIIVSGSDDGNEIREQVLTWNAGQTITITIDQRTSSCTITVAGAASGNGTSSTYTREDILTGSTLTWGAWGSGGFQLGASSTGDIDDGNDSITGTLSQTLGALTSSGAGVAPIAGAASRTLGALTSSGAGVAPVVGAAAPTLGALTSSAAGAVAVVGAASPTLGALTLEAAGGGPGGPVSGALDATLGALTSSAAGAVAVVGAAAPTLGALTSSATGRVSVTGQLAKTLGALTLSASNVVDGPQFGAHASARVLYGTFAGTVTTSAIATQASGSTFVIVTGGNIGDITDAPTDSKSNTYTLLGSIEEYDRWPGYGIAVWICENGTGGTGHTFSQEYGQTLGYDECTIIVAEVKNGLDVVDFGFSQHLTGTTLTGPTVTTTGAAVLLAFASGDNVTGSTTTMSLSGGYTLDDDSTFADHPNGYVPIGLWHASKSTPGSYGYTVTESPDQGAIMVNVAVQTAVGIQGSGGGTLGALTNSGAGTVGASGQLAKTLGAMTGGGAGVAPVAGAASPTLGALTSSGAGAAAVVGAASPTLGTLTTAAAGGVRVTGAGAATLGELTATGEGTVGQGQVVGQLAGTLGALIASGAGRVAITGALAATLGPLTSHLAIASATRQLLTQESHRSMIIPVISSSDALAVGAASGQFATINAMAAGEFYLYSCNQNSYIAQGANPTATNGAGSMYVPANTVIPISGALGARLAAIRDAVSGVATLTRVQVF